MSDYDHESRQRDLAKSLVEAYTLIAKLLEMLPLPISIPPRIEGDWTGEKASAAIIKAEDLVWDLPMASSTQRLISQMCLDWVTGHHFGSFDRMYPAPWRLDIVEYAIARIFGQAALVESRLIVESDQDSHEE